MRYFDNGNRLSMDQCAIQAREYENQSIIDYNLYNFFTNGDCKSGQSKAREMILEYPNMRYRNGYGIADGCVIDDDSRIRLNKELREKEPQQLCTRLFRAVPDLAKGSVVPGLESMLVQGVDTGALRDCHKLAEVPYYQPVPLTTCMSSYIKTAGDVLPDTFTIGRPSKEIFLQERKRCKRS
jgi:hypothetical protein